MFITIILNLIPPYIKKGTKYYNKLILYNSDIKLL